MADTLTYNGVTINTPNVDTISAEAVYDDAGVSVIYTKYHLMVKGTIQGSSASDFNTNYDNLTKALLVPRKPLVVNMGGTDIFDIPSGDDGLGPKPIRADVKEIVGARFAVVVFEIEVYLQENCNSPSNVISHIFSVRHAIDDQFMTTRTIHGRIRVRQAATNNNPDLLRGLVTPSMPLGFKTESQSFIVSEDGLQLEYEIVHKEVYRTAPLGTCVASGRFSHQMHDLVWFNHFSIELKGSKADSKIALFNAAFLVASSRIDFAKEFIKQGVIEEELYDNVVRFSVTTLVGDNPANPNGVVPLGTKIFAYLAGSDGNFSRNIGPYGTALIAAAKVAFYDPCGSSGSSVAETQVPASMFTPGIAGGSYFQEGAYSNGGSQSSVSTEQYQYPYTHWNQFETFEQKNGLAVTPSAKAGTPGKIYQLHNPYMIITQTGDAVRSGADVVIPEPTIPFTGYLAEKNVLHYAPKLNPDKNTFSFAASWSYHILVPMGDQYTAFVSDSQSGLTDVDQTARYSIPSNAAITTSSLPSQTFNVPAPILVKKQ